jgi:hypothetical protein
MTRLRLEPAPSPNGTNFARKFLITLPRGVDPKGALDAALKKVGRDADLGERDDLRRSLEALLERHVQEDRLMEAIEDLNTVFGDRKVYGDRGREADDEEHEGHHEALREFAGRHGLSDDATEELVELSMPRNAREGGMGGRVHEADDRRRHGARDRHRGAGDRRMAADSATDSFNRMFPGAARIGLGAL